MKKLTTLIACCVLIIGIVVFGGPTATIQSSATNVYPEAYAQPGVNPFVGKWVNSDSQTSSFTKMAISIEDGAMMVQLWGACSPEDCYWGRVAAQVPKCETQRIEATWILPISNEFQEIIYFPPGDYLIVRSKSLYTYDQSERTESATYYFVRGDFTLNQ